MGYIKAGGMRYYRFLNRLHQQNLFDWYMEIGCRKGRSFAPVRGKTIAVDPFFRINSNVIGNKPALHVFQATSDDFFAGGFLKKTGIKLSFSFLDGMHLFEFLLRDFMNTERFTRPDGVIAMHDCCPFDNEMTTRDLDNLPAGAWTGDVWKIIPILQEYRPDLKITVLDCPPTGLVLVSGLSPTNRVLERNYDEIVARYTDMDIDAYGPERFYGSFVYTDSHAFAAEGWKLFEPLRLEQTADMTPRMITP
ncbi:MAG: hypothetical protein R3E44_10530 [Paracoccaceae bacterium]